MFDISAINKARALRWHPTGIASWSLSDWAVALGGEIGEVLEVIEFNCLTEYFNHPNPVAGHVWVESLGGEIADSYTYLDLFCAAASLHLPECRNRGAAQLGLERPFRFTKGYSIVSMSVSLAADMGKLQDYVKKLNRERDGLAGNRQSNGELWAGVADRVGLIGNKLDWLATKCGLSLETCVREKFNAVSCRMNLPERL